MKPIIIKNNTKGYNYDYTDLANLNKTLDDLGISYMQKTETDEKNGSDYVWTKIYYNDGTETEWMRGAKIVNATLQGKSNPAQEYGSALTYARRYSLFTVLGVATTDDDAECLTETKETKKAPTPANTAKQNIAKAIENHESAKKAQQVQIDMIFDLVNKLNLTQEQQQKEMEFFKKTKYVELTEAEANKYIKNLEKRLEVAQNGKS